MLFSSNSYKMKKKQQLAHNHMFHELFHWWHGKAQVNGLNFSIWPAAAGPNRGMTLPRMSIQAKPEQTI